MGIGDVMSALWGECDDASGMYFCAQRHVAVELIDPVTGARVPWREGAEGEPIYTTFDREATPTLRYRSADHVVVLGTECRCGRTASKIRCIGRTDDMLIYKGMNVYPSAIRDVVLSRFSDAVAPYMRIWKERKDQVRLDSPIPLEIERRLELPASGFPASVGPSKQKCAGGCRFASRSPLSNREPSRAPPTRPLSSRYGKTSALWAERPMAYFSWV